MAILNTMIQVTKFKPPWSMAPFAHRGIGELWIGGMNKPLFRTLMMMRGLGDPAAISRGELGAYLDLMRGDDRGRAFLRIMRSTERTPQKEALYLSTVRDVPYPVQVMWAADDPSAEAHRLRGASTRRNRPQVYSDNPREALPAGGSGAPPR